MTYHSSPYRLIGGTIMQDADWNKTGEREGPPPETGPYSNPRRRRSSAFPGGMNNTGFGVNRNGGTRGGAGRGGRAPTGGGIPPQLHQQQQAQQQQQQQHPHHHHHHHHHQQRHVHFPSPSSDSHGRFLANAGGGIGGDPQGPYSQTQAAPVDWWGWMATAVTGCMAAVCVTGLISMLLVLYLTVRPFSRTMYRRLAAHLAASSFLDAIALLLPNIRIYLTGDSDLPSPVGTSFLVSNHIVDADWWIILMLGRSIGLRGTVKAFLRNEFLHINQHNTGSGNGSPTRSLSSSLLSSDPAVSATLAGIHSTPATASPSSAGAAASSAASNRSQDLTAMAKLLSLFLEFPLANDGGEDYIADREQLFSLLRSFADDGTANGSANHPVLDDSGVMAAASTSAVTPVHLLLFPEAWCLHSTYNTASRYPNAPPSPPTRQDRRSILAKSNEFAQREGRPQFQHLLLPRTRGFRASLECLRDSFPMVYDVTLAYNGYDGSLPPSAKLSMTALWSILRQFPREVHVRIKRYSMDEALADTMWLDKKWAEKDRLLTFFARYQYFPVEASTGGSASSGTRSAPVRRRLYRILDTRRHSWESSCVALLRLCIVPWAIPILLLMSIPVFWTVFWLWMVQYAYRLLFGHEPNGMATGSAPHHRHAGDDNHEDTNFAGDDGQTPGSATVTPFFPATPFVSPSTTNWRDMMASTSSAVPGTATNRSAMNSNSGSTHSTVVRNNNEDRKKQ